MEEKKKNIYVAFRRDYWIRPRRAAGIRSLQNGNGKDGRTGLISFKEERKV